MKALGLIILSTIALAGCVTKNPNYNPASPATPVSGTNAEYVPDTSSFQRVTNTISAINTATAPVDPYAPLVQDGLAIVGALVTGVSVMFANSKNKQANTANAAAQHLATVLPDNMVAQAINSAPTPAIAAAVSAHLSAAPETGVVAINTKPAA